MSRVFQRIRIDIGKGEAWALLAALGYSLDNVFIAYAVKGPGINYLLGALLRTLPLFLFILFKLIISKFFQTSGLSSAPVQNKQISPFKDYKIILALIAFGVMTFFLGNTLFFSAMQKGGVLVTSPLIGTQVLWAALFAVFLLGEDLNWKMIAGMLTSVSGIFVLALGKSSSIDLSLHWWLAIPLALGAAICWSLSGVLIAYVQRKGVDRFHALLFAVAVGILTINGYLLIAGKISVYTITPVHLMGKVFIAGTFSMVALIAITTALAVTTIASASTINSLQVGLAPLIAWLLLHEKMNFLIACGIVLILLGVIVVQLNRRPPDANGVTPIQD